MFCEYYNFDKESTMKMKIAALLHDIGKLDANAVKDLKEII